MLFCWILHFIKDNGANLYRYMEILPISKDVEEKFIFHNGNISTMKWMVPE
jgi:hypothetical protein